MARLVLIDGNSILNRAFYGIMGSNMLQTADGTYTNAVYGFLTIIPAPASTPIRQRIRR